MNILYPPPPRTELKPSDQARCLSIATANWEILLWIKEFEQPSEGERNTFKKQSHQQSKPIKILGYLFHLHINKPSQWI